MLQLYIDLSSSRLACRDIQRIQRIQRIQLYSYTRYTAYSPVQPPSATTLTVRRCSPRAVPAEAQQHQISPYFNPTYTSHMYTRTGWIGQPPVLDRYEVVTIDGDVATLRQATP